MLLELKALRVLKTEFRNNIWWRLNSKDLLNEVPDYEKNSIRDCFKGEFLGEPDFIKLVKPGEDDFPWIDSDYLYPS
jgi:hypothetical protein